MSFVQYEQPSVEGMHSIIPRYRKYMVIRPTFTPHDYEIGRTLFVESW